MPDFNKDIKTSDKPLKCKVMSTDDPLSAGRVQIFFYSKNDYGNESNLPWAYVVTTGARPNVGDIVYVLGDKDEYTVIGMLSNSEDKTFGSVGGDSGLDTDNGNPDDYCASGSSLAELTVPIISQNEVGDPNGGYNLITPNDNGALSIGRMQWHGDQAKTVVTKITNKNKKKFKDQLSKLNLSASWAHKILTKESEEYKAINNILKSDESKAYQKKALINEINKYFDNAKSNCGITDAASLIYFADCYNQSPRSATQIGKECGSSCTLDIIHTKTMSNSVLNPYKTRRERTYKYIQDLIKEGKLVKGKNNLTSVADDCEDISLIDDGYLYPCKKYSTLYHYDDKIYSTKEESSNNQTYSKISQGLYIGDKNGKCQGTNVLATCSGKIKLKGSKISKLGTQIELTPNSIQGEMAVRKYIANKMKSWLGKLNYVYGGHNLNTGTDCSYTTYLAYRKATEELKNKGTLSKQYAPGTCSSDIWSNYESRGFKLITTSSSVSASKLLPADVICYNGHIEMYYGDGKILNHGGPGKGPSWRDFNGRLASKGGFRGIIRLDLSNDKKLKKANEDNNEVFIYGHLLSAKVKESEEKNVNQGDVIGTIGNTGDVESPMLFFGYKKNGSYYDPEDLKLKRKKKK